MGKRRKRRGGTLIGKALGGIFRLLSEGIVKAGPVVLLAVASFGIFWSIRQNLYADPGFLIQRLEVSPQGALSSDRIQDLETRYLNQNLFSISPAEVSRHLLSDPKVREARVTRAFPQTLRVEILDRNTFAEVEFFPKGPFFLVGEDGVVLGVEPERNQQVLLIEAFETKQNELEKGHRFVASGFREAVGLARAWVRHPLNRSEAIERIRLDHLGNVSLALNKGPELRFGRDPLKKLSTLDSLIPLLRGPDRNQIIYLELQYEDVIVRKK